jgi:hypothetical protein
VLRDTDAADGATGARDADRRLDRIAVADAFEHGVDAFAVGECADALDRLLAAFGDDIGGAQLARPPIWLRSQSAISTPVDRRHEPQRHGVRAVGSPGTSVAAWPERGRIVLPRGHRDRGRPGPSPENPRKCGGFRAADGIRTHDLLHGKCLRGLAGLCGYSCLAC